MTGLFVKALIQATAHIRLKTHGDCPKLSDQGSFWDGIRLEKLKGYLVFIMLFNQTFGAVLKEAFVSSIQNKNLTAEWLHSLAGLQKRRLSLNKGRPNWSPAEAGRQL